MQKDNDDMYWQIINRQMTMVDKKDQEKFKNTKISVIGCGALGGQCIEMLARMGVGKLVVVDEDSFDTTNLNRQTLATVDTIGMQKSKIAKEKVKKINPYVEVTSYNEHVTVDNIDKIIDDSDIVVDAVDNVLARVIVSRCAKDKKIPFIHGAVHETLGQVSVFTPESKSYEEMFNLPSKNKPLDEDIIKKLKKVTTGPPPVIGPTPNMVACIEAMEAYKIITGIGDVCISPNILTFDLLDLTSFEVIEI